MQISIITKRVTDGNLTVAIKYEVAYGPSINIFRFDIGSMIKVKVMHISTVIISKIVTDWADTTTVI